MNRCAIPGRSCTTKWLSRVNRCYSTSYLSSSDGFSNAKPSTTEKVATSDANSSVDSINEIHNVADGLNATQDGKHRSTPHQPRDLPLSPFMDQTVITAREKHRLPKSPPTKTPTPLQDQLSKNPYAQALASPIRMCQVTKMQLPKYFLQDFQPMAHPETSEPWWVPTSLRRRRNVSESKESEIATASNQKFENPPLPRESPPTLLSSKHRHPTHPSLGPGTYTLAHQAVFSNATLQPWKYFRSGSKDMHSGIARKVRDQATWRTDMDKFILELMRRRVIEGLVYLVQRKRGFVAGCVDWEDAKMSRRQPAVILWTGKAGSGDREGSLDTKAYVNPIGGQESGNGRRDEQEQNQEGDGPPPFATLTAGKEKGHLIPVHNLPMLLGPSHLMELRKQCSIFNKEILIVRGRRTTVDIQMKLWRLQGYLAFPEARSKTSSEQENGEDRLCFGHSQARY